MNTASPDSLPQRISELCYQASAIVRLVEDRLNAITGDEQPVDIASDSANWTYALAAVREIMSEAAGLTDSPR